MTKRLRYIVKLIKEVCPAVGEIWKYTPFPAGTLPAVLVKKDPQKSYGFLSKAKEKDHIHKIVSSDWHKNAQISQCCVSWGKSLVDWSWLAWLS